MIGVEPLLGGALIRVLVCLGHVGMGGNKTSSLVAHVAALGLLMLMSYEVWKYQDNNLMRNFFWANSPKFQVASATKTNGGVVGVSTRNLMVSQWNI